MQKLMDSLSKEQEILMNIADMISYIYVAESVMLRAEKLQHKSQEDTSKEKEELADYAKDIADVYLYSSVDKVAVIGKEALNSFAEGDDLKMMLMGLRRFTKTEPFNVKEARQRIAQKLIEENRYPF